MAQEDIVIKETDVADDGLRNAILAPLVEYNAAQTKRHDHRPLIIAIEDLDGNVIGGLWAHTAYDWLFVQLLVVPEGFRGRGLGSELMKRAEDEARRRGCHGAWLDTFEFQARGFYERLGYRCFGELENYPVGPRHFMKKSLQSQE
ncbi:MAG: GNAT family N-acetyltransferase [Vicinamibacterales bacterium]